MSFFNEKLVIHSSVHSFVFDQQLIIPVLVAIATKFKIKLNSFAKF